MTKLSPKEAQTFLSQAILLNERIDQDVERTHMLRTLLVDSPCEADDTHVKELARELGELETRIIENVDMLVDLKAVITHRIKNMTDIKLQLVLELRYLCGRTWEQVADDLDMKPLHARRLHRIALRAYCCAI